MAAAARPRDRVIVAIDERRSAILEIIRQAKRSVLLSLFRCNDQAIFDELAAATARGVEVEVLTTSRAKGGRKRLEKLWSALEPTGAVVRTYNDPVVKYHAKYLVVDDGPAVVASLNFTRKCFWKTCDALVVTWDPAVIGGLRRLMAADSQGARAPEGITERLVIGPERARRQFTTLIEQARSSIRLIDAKLSDPDLVSLLRARRAGGLTVDVYDGKRVAGLKSHGKIMLLDDRTAVVGSLALAALSLDFRREIAIVVDDPEASAPIVDLFRTLNAAAGDAGTIQAGAVDGASC